MIKKLKNLVTDYFSKANWVDQNGIVFGYSDEQQCCETYGWGVFDEKSHERVCDCPDGLPYHFDFEHGAEEFEYNYPVSEKDVGSMFEKHCGDCLDCVRVRLLPDDNKDRTLIFEAFTAHNGYYLHSFEFAKKEFSKFVGK